MKKELNGEIIEIQDTCLEQETLETSPITASEDENNEQLDVQEPIITSETPDIPLIKEEMPVEASKPVEKVGKAEKAEKPKRKAASAVLKLGRLIDDDNDLVEAEMPGYNQSVEIAEMKRDIKQNKVCYGTVIALEIENESLRMIVKRGTIRVIIPADDFMAFSDYKDGDLMSEEDRFLRYRRRGSHMLGAVVSFVPKALGFNDEGVPFAVASRKQAMMALQDKYFYSEKAKVQVGSLAKASIISVSPTNVTVECLGVEKVIGTGALSAFEYINDASDMFKTGQGLIVAVEKLEVDRANHTIDVDFSHSLVERLEAKVETANAGMVNGRYIATVVANITDYYIVILNGLKIRGLVKKSEYLGTAPLEKGDVVAMLVTGFNKEKNLVVGKCLKTS